MRELASAQNNHRGIMATLRRAVQGYLNLCVFGKTAGIMANSFGVAGGVAGASFGFHWAVTTGQLSARQRHGADDTPWHLIIPRAAVLVPTAAAVGVVYGVGMSCLWPVTLPLAVIAAARVPADGV